MLIGTGHVGFATGDGDNIPITLRDKVGQQIGAREARGTGDQRCAFSHEISFIEG
jgi:hypothetical protein